MHNFIKKSRRGGHVRRFFNYYSKFFYIFQDTRRLKILIHNNYNKNLIKCQGRALKALGTGGSAI